MAVQKRNLLGIISNKSDNILDQSIVELINRKRRQIMVHSAIYYRFCTSIISDAEFDKWSRELVKLQKDYPKESEAAPLYDDFKDWDGSSGYNLNYYPFLGTAEYLMKICEEFNEH